MSLVNMIMRKVIKRLIKVKKMITRKFRSEEIIINGAFFVYCLVDNGLQVMVEKKGEMFVGYNNK